MSNLFQVLHLDVTNYIASLLGRKDICNILECVLNGETSRNTCEVVTCAFANFQFPKSSCVPLLGRPNVWVWNTLWTKLFVGGTQYVL